MGSKPHGRPPIFNEGYLGPFDGLRADIKVPLPALAITEHLLHSRENVSL